MKKISFPITIWANKSHANLIPHNSPNSCQQRHSNSTLPKQIASYHTNLLTAVTRGSRIRLFQIRQPHTTQFSKQLSAESFEFDCSQSDYLIPHKSPNQTVESDCFKSEYSIPHNSPNQAVEFDCSKSEYSIPHNSPNRCQPRDEASVLTQVLGHLSFIQRKMGHNAQNFSA